MVAKANAEKSIFKSMTAWGAVLLAALQGGESVGMVPPETSNSVVGVAQAIGTLLVVLGLRRAINDNIKEL